MGGDDPGVIGITQRKLLMEMRDDIRGLRSVVDSVARDQALSVERRASMQRVADTITARLDRSPAQTWQSHRSRVPLSWTSTIVLPAVRRFLCLR